MIDMEDIEALEEELQKIQVFGRELPLSLHLVRQTIESIRKQRKMQRDMPVLEEFMPLKPSLSSVKEGISHHEDNKKMNWLQSVQLWNQEHDTTLIEIDKEKKEKENISQPHKKARRCWSAELHRSFLDALQQLGGSHAATPKQIRELMKVDGLTNDEIKSHLQKYRLHTRRSSTAVQRNFDFLSLCDKNSMASLRSPITIFGPKSTILEHGPKNFPFRADN